MFLRGKDQPKRQSLIFYPNLLTPSSKWAIFKISNIQIDSETVSTKTIETHWNEGKKYLHITHFPFSLSSKPLFHPEF